MRQPGCCLSKRMPGREWKKGPCPHPSLLVGTAGFGIAKDQHLRRSHPEAGLDGVAAEVAVRKHGESFRFRETVQSSNGFGHRVLARHMNDAAFGMRLT